MNSFQDSVKENIPALASDAAAQFTRAAARIFRPTDDDGQPERIASAHSL